MFTVGFTGSLESYDVVLQFPFSGPNIFHFGTSRVFMIIDVNYSASDYCTA